MMLQCPYSKSQITQYLNHIGFSQSTSLTFELKPDLSTLTQLQRHHLATFPFENLDLHYSSAQAPRQPSLDPVDLFDKFVVRGSRGRGGYCLEQNTIFLYILRGLGFEVYSAGARVQQRGLPGTWTGWSHMVNIVTLAGNIVEQQHHGHGEETQRWMVDVGFGGKGPTRPLQLMDDFTTLNIGIQQMRLHYDRSICRGQPLWVYQVSNGPAMDDSSWQSWYGFSEVEFLPQDFEIMNYWVSTNPRSWFTYAIVVVKMVLDANAEAIVGKLYLVGAEVMRNDGVNSVLIKTCTTEQERIDVLQEMFGVTMTAREAQGIKSTAAALAEKS